MNFNDEQLSAFLDGELPHAEMENLRNALARDEVLGDRLAELALVDTAIRRTYATIDARPVPEAITALLNDDHSLEPKVVPMSRGKFLRERIGQPAALAASVALAVGIALGSWLTSAPERDAWQYVSAALETQPGGTAVSLKDGRALTPRLTFRDTGGNFCRLFELEHRNGAQQSLACRQNGEWELKATAPLEQTDEPLYRPASGSSPLDHILDDTLSAGPFDRDEEARLIAEQWQ